MCDKFWWDTGKDDSWINEILKFSAEARMWYLKTDAKVRLKMFILRNEDFQGIIHLWKRLNIVKNDFGEETGGAIIRQAIEEIKQEFPDNAEWETIISEKITQERSKLNDELVSIIWEK
jgi:hypothetical protein